MEAEEDEERDQRLTRMRDYARCRREAEDDVERENSTDHNYLIIIYPLI